jgi:hypothetical protein
VKGISSVHLSVASYFFFSNNKKLLIPKQREHLSKNVSDVFFLFYLKVGVEESIVNAPFVSLQSKNTNNSKNGVSFKHLIRDL